MLEAPFAQSRQRWLLHCEPLSRRVPASGRQDVQHQTMTVMSARTSAQTALDSMKREDTGWGVVLGFVTRSFEPEPGSARHAHQGRASPPSRATASRCIVHRRACAIKHTATAALRRLMSFGTVTPPRAVRLRPRYARWHCRLEVRNYGRIPLGASHGRHGRSTRSCSRPPLCVRALIP